VKAINRALADRGQERAAGSFVLQSGTDAEPVVGRVIGKRLIDELGDRIGLVIDGADGRVHHVQAGHAGAQQDIRVGSIVEAGRHADARPADRTIAALAHGGGEYQPSVHRALIDSGEIKLPPGADLKAFIDSHVRRLEALRRARIVERVSADRWTIPADFEQRTAAFEAQRSRQSNVRLLSAFDLDRQVTSDGATWIDRQLVSRNRVSLAAFGFGAEVSEAFEARKTELVRQGHAHATPEGGVRVRPDLVATLERQELARTGAELATMRGLPFRAAETGEYVRGTFTGTAQLASGKFAVVESPFDMQLVPWRPVIDEHLGREVSGIARGGGGIEWTVGRERGLGI